MDMHEPKKPPTFIADQLTVLLQSHCSSLLKVIALNNDNNYSADFHAPLKTFQPVILPMTLSEIDSLCGLVISTDDFDDFCKKFLYFPHLAMTIVFSPSQSTVGRSSNEKTFWKNLEEITKNQDFENPFDVSIKDVEMDIIRNMSGYVFKTFMRIFWNVPVTPFFMDLTDPCRHFEKNVSLYFFSRFVFACRFVFAGRFLFAGRLVFANRRCDCVHLFPWNSKWRQCLHFAALLVPPFPLKSDIILHFSEYMKRWIIDLM